MSDLISRQAAIDAINSCRVEDNYMFVWRTERNQTLAYAVEKLNTLPSAQPEIIRCKDCKHHDQTNCPIEKYFSLDGFCSRAERREVTT